MDVPITSPSFSLLESAGRSYPWICPGYRTPLVFLSFFAHESSSTARRGWTKNLGYNHSRSSRICKYSCTCYHRRIHWKRPLHTLGHGDIVVLLYRRRSLDPHRIRRHSDQVESWDTSSRCLCPSTHAWRAAVRTADTVAKPSRLHIDTCNSEITGAQHWKRLIRTQFYLSKNYEHLY